MSLEVGKIQGIKIRLHFTLIITFFLIDWTLSTFFMPQYVKGLAPVDYWVMGSVGTGILFFSILLHELAHSMVATRYKIPVRSITLFIFGGVSDIEKEPKDFHEEFKMAIAGPLMSLGIGAVFGIAFMILFNGETGPGQSMMFLGQVKGILFYGTVVNFIVGGFNLLPAFPLDGGRVLRAALVRWRKDYHEATKIATTIGIIISYGFMGFGFLFLIRGDFVGGIWTMLIGWFLQSGAHSYMSQFELTNALQGIVVGSIMKTKIISVKEDSTADLVLKDFFMATMKSELPVTDEGGHLLGMVALKAILTIPPEKLKETTVRDVMIGSAHLAIMRPETKAENAIMQMIQKRVGKVFVCDEENRLLGVISKTDIIELANERQKYLRTLKTG